MIAGIAAGHPATAAAGADVLADGGTAADAAVAACLASCVAETVMTGFLGGGHAVYYEASSGVARNLDCFVAVPSGGPGELLELHVPFGAELVHYAVGPASCGVPGLPGGLDLLLAYRGISSVRPDPHATGPTGDRLAHAGLRAVGRDGFVVDLAFAILSTNGMVQDIFRADRLDCMEDF